MKSKKNITNRNRTSRLRSTKNYRRQFSGVDIVETTWMSYYSYNDLKILQKTEQRENKNPTNPIFNTVVEYI